jgi:two-component system, sensor histidine kinase PdtaS
MKKLLLLVILLVFSLSAISQTKQLEKIDSLNTVIKNTKRDTTVVNRLHDICTIYENFDLASLKKTNQKIYDISTKTKYKRGLGFYYLHNYYYELCTGGKANALLSLKKALFYFKASRDTSNYLYTSMSLSYYYMLDGNNEVAKKNLRKDLPLAIKTKDYKNLGNFYTTLGHIYQCQDSIKEALQNSRKALHYFQVSKSSNTYAVYEFMAAVYSDLKQYKEALKNTDLAINATEDEITQHVLSLQKVDLLHNLNKYDAALDLSLKIKQFFEKNKQENSVYFAPSLILLAKSYFFFKKDALGIQHLNEILQRPNLDITVKIVSFRLLTQAYIRKKDIKSAKIFADKSVKLLDSVDDNKTKSEIFLNKSIVDESTSDYKSALAYLKKYNTINEAHATKINQDKIQNLQIEYDVAQKNFKIKNLEVAQLKKALENKKQKDWIFYIAIALIITLFTVLFFIINNKTIKKKNKIIEAEKLLTQKSLAEKEILLKEIHHRVKNNMQLVISLLKIQSLDAKQLSIDEFINVSEARITSMALIHENLYKSDTLDKVCFKDYVNNLTQSITGSQHGAKNVVLQTDVSETFFDIQTAIPIGLIVNELVNNAYKHAFLNKPNGKIGIALTEHQGKYTLSISDDGVGFKHNPKKPGGLGLELVKLLVSQIKGVLQMDTTTGTSYTVQFQNELV